MFVRAGIAALALATVVGVGARALTVSIAEFQVAAAAESLVEARFVVVNDDPRAVRVTLTLTDWDDDPDGVTRLYTRGTVSRSCAPWMAVDGFDSSLGPFEEREVDVRVRVPADLNGTYWGGILVRSASIEASILPNQLAVSGEVLVRFFITVPPAEKQAVVSSVRVLSLEPLRIAAQLSNTGCVRLYDVEGVVSLEAPSGFETSVSLPFVDVLPGHRFDMETELPWSLDVAGLYLVRVVFDYGAETLVAGQVVVRVP